MTLEERWQAELDALRRAGRYRTLKTPLGLDFSSNDYLGYGKLFWNEAELPRSGQASRLLRGHHEIWLEVENRLAAWHGAEAALMMTSGYVANEGLLSTIVGPQDWVASDEYNHASIIDGLKLSKAEKHIYPHNDAERFRASLPAEGAGPSQRQRFVVTESLFGMEGDVFPDALLGPFPAIIDEAHATGCLGQSGAGLVSRQLRQSANILATVHTGGKALGVAGAYICCSNLLKDYLVNRCRHLIFTTALPPALGQWWLDALDRVASDQAARDRLEENTAIFRRALAQHGIDAKGQHYIVPVVLGEDHAAVRAAELLQSQGFDVRAIRPPTVPHGSARLRISIHADHERATLLALAEAVARVT
jgi:8-amino-7-oxononanoate synthase